MEFRVIRNDIAKTSADAIVLPANRKLRIGAGASMAIFEAAGREDLETECAIRLDQTRKQGMELVPGVSIPTHAFALPAKVILHTIVPKWDARHPDSSYEELCKSYASALVLADEMGMESIAFPLLASGNNGFDADAAIDIALQSLEQYQPKHQLSEALLITFVTATTNKLRKRGYTIEEAIGRRHVLGQGIHQAQSLRPGMHGGSDTPLPQKALDDAIEWLRVPSNQQMVFDLALVVAGVVIATRGKLGKV